MVDKVRAWFAMLAAAMVVAFAGSAYAACCNVPTTHQVRIPSVTVGVPAARGCTQSCGGCQTNCGPPPGCNANCGGGSFEFNAQVNASANSYANANASSAASAFANSSAFGLGGALNGSRFVGVNGGSSFYVDYASGYIPNLSVEEGAAAVSVPYSATRTVIKIVAIQAVCVDDKAIPHPASQVTPDKEIDESYDGELFRCLAGTRMQYTVAEYAGKVSFDKGQTTTCDKGSALYHAAGGKVECRAQKPARDCNERSLLRRFGAGIKIVKMVWTETYTAYRTEVRQSGAAVMGMVIDGGVGGIAH
jgi:hypothetical protein